jgi:RNA polymerase sigma-70 factor, ECF subfamily
VKATTRRRQKFEGLAANVYVPLQKYLIRRAHPDAVDDVLSEALTTLWRRIDDVPDQNPLPWCYGVARRTLANHRRGEARRLQLVDRLTAEPQGTGEPEDSDPALESALEQLSREERELIHLWAWEELEPREIAVVLESTPNAISLRLTRLKKKLGAEIERQNQAGSGHIPGKHAQET